MARVEHEGRAAEAAISLSWKNDLDGQKIVNSVSKSIIDGEGGSDSKNNSNAVSKSNQKQTSTEAPELASHIQNLPVGILVSDTGGLVTFANTKAIELFGGDVTGSPVEDLYEGADKQFSHTATEIASALMASNGKPISNVTMVINRIDGSQQTVSASFSLDEITKNTTALIMPGVSEMRQAAGKVSRILAIDHSLDEILLQTTELTRTLCRADRCYIKLYDEFSDSLKFTALSSVDNKAEFKKEESDVFEGLTGYVFTTRMTYRTDDISKDKKYSKALGFDDTISKVAAPLLYTKERDRTEICFGILTVDGLEPHQFDIATEEILEVLAEHAAIGIARVRITDEVRSDYSDIFEELKFAQDAIGVYNLLHDGKNMISDAVEVLTELEENVVTLGKIRAWNHVKSKIDRLRNFMDLLIGLGRALKYDRSKDDLRSGFTVIDLHELATRVVNVTPAKSSPIQVHLKNSDQKCDVFGDERQLIFMMFNLVRNAVTAIESQSGQGVVEIQVLPSPNHDQQVIDLIIKDDGPGMDKQLLRKIRKGVSISKQSGGVGIGLISVAQTIKIHGGSFEVTSKLGNGTRFTIHLPAS